MRRANQNRADVIEPWGPPLHSRPKPRGPGPSPPKTPPLPHPLPLLAEALLGLDRFHVLAVRVGLCGPAPVARRLASGDRNVDRKGGGGPSTGSRARFGIGSGAWCRTTVTCEHGLEPSSEPWPSCTPDGCALPIRGSHRGWYRRPCSVRSPGRCARYLDATAEEATARLLLERSRERLIGGVRSGSLYADAGLIKLVHTLSEALAHVGDRPTRRVGRTINSTPKIQARSAACRPGFSRMDGRLAQVGVDDGALAPASESKRWMQGGGSCSRRASWRATSSTWRVEPAVFEVSPAARPPTSAVLPSPIPPGLHEHSVGVRAQDDFGGSAMPGSSRNRRCVRSDRVLIGGGLASTIRGAAIEQVYAPRGDGMGRRGG